MSTALSVDEVRAQVDEHRDGIETAEQDARRRVGEPLVYQERGSHSYFRDLALADRGNGDAGARLERHGRQMDALPQHETRTVLGTEYEYRVNPNVTAGTGGEFAPPAWLNQYFATARRPGEIIQRLIRDHGHAFDLPQGVSSINLPRVTVGTTVSSQTPGGGVASTDVETEKVKAQAVVFAGNSDWAIQDLEQSPQGAHLDWVVFTDMAESLDAEVEAQLVAGKGATVTELLGLLNITGINAVSLSSTEVKEAFEYLGRAVAQVGKERKRPPDAWLLSTSRLAWLAMTPESEQRPLVLTDNVGEAWPSCSLATIGVYPNDAIPRTVNGNQEPIFCVRSDDFLLWLSSPRTMVAGDVLSGSLGVRFQLHRTVAAMLGRYPTGISAITGAGTKPASGY